MSEVTDLAVVGVGVIVDVGLAFMLPVDVAMWSVSVFERGVIVLVFVQGAEVLDCGGRTARCVMSHVQVFVYMGQGSMGVPLELLLWHLTPSLPRGRPSRGRETTRKRNSSVNAGVRPTGRGERSEWRYRSEPSPTLLAAHCETLGH